MLPLLTPDTKYWGEGWATEGVVRDEVRGDRALSLAKGVTSTFLASLSRRLRKATGNKASGRKSPKQLATPWTSKTHKMLKTASSTFESQKTSVGTT